MSISMDSCIAWQDRSNVTMRLTIYSESTTNVRPEGGHAKSKWTREVVFGCGNSLIGKGGQGYSRPRPSVGYL
jgi:hypothetical protein